MYYCRATQDDQCWLVGTLCWWSGAMKRQPVRLEMGGLCTTSRRNVKKISTYRMARLLQTLLSVNGWMGIDVGSSSSSSTTSTSTRVRITFASHRSIVAAPSVWNSLPSGTDSLVRHHTFRFLFEQALSSPLEIFFFFCFYFSFYCVFYISFALIIWFVFMYCICFSHPATFCQ